MLKVNHGPFQPALEDSFIADVQGLKAGRPLIPIAVVAPSRRLADRLQRLFAERGLSLLGVRFHTFHSLALEVCEPEGLPARLVGDPLFHDRIVDELLRREEGKQLPRGLAAAWRSSIRDLVDAGVQGAGVRESLRDYFSADREDDWKSLESLLDLQEKYLERLSVAGVLPGSGLTREAAARVNGGSASLSRYEAILYYGFYDLTGVQADFFRAVAAAHADVRVYFPYRKEHPAFRFASRFFDVQLGANPSRALESGVDSRALGLALDELFSDKSASAAPAAGNLRLISASGSRDECWAVAKEILALREAKKVGFHEIGVVARTLERYRTVLPEVFRENAIPFSMPEGEPLLRHPAAKLCLTLLTLRRREFPAGAVLDVVQSPYFRGHGPRGQAMVAQWTKLVTKTGVHSGWLQWESKIAPWAEKDFETVHGIGEEGGRRIAAADTARLWSFVSGLHQVLLGPGPNSTWTAMAEHALRLLEETFEVPADDPGAPAWRAAREAVDGMKAFDLAFAPPRWEDFLETLEERLRRATLDAARDNLGVRVLDAMDARGESFRHLFLIGLAEGSFPRTVEEDPLLPDRVREQLQHPGGYWILPKRSGLDGLDGYGEEKLLFYLMASAAAETLTCVYPRSDDDGRPQVPSFYLRALCRASGRRLEDGEDIRVERRPFAKLDPLAARAPALLSPKEVSLWTARSGEDPSRFLESLGRPSKLLSACLSRLPALNASGEPGALDGLVRMPPERLERTRRRGYSPSALESFTACPFKFFASRVLDLDDPEEPVERGELAAWMKGQIYHETLRSFHETLRVENFWSGGTDWGDALDRAFEQTVAAWDWKRAGLYPLLWEAERLRMRAYLADFAAWDIEARKADDYRPRGFERELSGTAAGIPLRGIVDRLDEGPDGVRVIDYKSRWRLGGLRKRVKDMKSLQPSLYLELVAAQGDPVAGAGFYSIEDAALDPDAVEHTFEKSDWEASRAGFLTNLTGIVKWIEDGRFPITPNEDRYETCWFCPFGGVCRKAHPRTRRRAEHSALRAELDALLRLELPDKRKKSAE